MLRKISRGLKVDKWLLVSVGGMQWFFASEASWLLIVSQN